MSATNRSIFVTGTASFNCGRNPSFLTQSDIINQNIDSIVPYVANISLAPSDLAAASAAASLKAANTNIDEVDLVFSCTQTPDYNNPGLAGFILRKLEAKSVPGLELKMSVAGPLQALEIAACMIRAGKRRRVLIVGCDTLSRYFIEAPQHPLAKLYGDGAGSFVVAAREDCNPSSGAVFELLSCRTGLVSSGKNAERIEVPQANQFPLRMTVEDLRKGRHLPSFDAQAFEDIVAQEAPLVVSSVRASVGAEIPVSAIITHSPLSPSALCKRGVFQSLSGAAVCDPILSDGYIGAAGIPRGLAALNSHPARAGESVALFGFGAGINIGAALLRVVS